MHRFAHITFDSCLVFIQYNKYTVLYNEMESKLFVFIKQVIIIYFSMFLVQFIIYISIPVMTKTKDLE